MTKPNKTRIVVCDKCDLRTRHEWQQWERRSLLWRAVGHVELVEGWVCTKCGHQSRIQRVGVVRVSAHT